MVLEVFRGENIYFKRSNCHVGVKPGFSLFGRTYQLAGRKVINENSLLKSHGSFLK
jgi:hypothetical protein